MQRPLGVAKGAVADARRPVAGATFPLAVAAAAVAVPLARAAQEVQHATQVRCCSGRHTADAPRIPLPECGPQSDLPSDYHPPHTRSVQEKGLQTAANGHTDCVVIFSTCTGYDCPAGIVWLIMSPSGAGTASRSRCGPILVQGACHAME